MTPRARMVMESMMLDELPVQRWAAPGVLFRHDSVFLDITFCSLPTPYRESLVRSAEHLDAACPVAPGPAPL